MALDEASYLEPSIHRDTIEAASRWRSPAPTRCCGSSSRSDVNKLEAGRCHHDGAVSLKGLAEQACSVLAGTAAEAEIDIQINAPDDLPPVFADEDKIAGLPQPADNAPLIRPPAARCASTSGRRTRAGGAS